MNSRAFLIILIVHILVTGCASHQSEDDLAINCIEETQLCKNSKYGCVSLRYPEESQYSSANVGSSVNSYCKYECIIFQAVKRLNSSGVSVFGYPGGDAVNANEHPSCVKSNPDILNAVSTKSCVGYRKDIEGTEEGAKCIAKVLGIKYQTDGCNADGFPYTVRLE